MSSDEKKKLAEEITSLENALKDKGKKPAKRKATNKKPKKTKIDQAEKERRRLEKKLIRVITKAGLSWTAWSALVEIADNINGHPIDTACWVYNEHTKRERIIFSPRIIKALPVAQLLLVFKHEMLHKSLYRGTSNVSNQELLNFALDAAINKILWLSNPKQAVKLGNWLFPEGSENRSSFYALMNPGVTSKDFAKMSPGVRIIAESIWWIPKEEKDGDVIRDKGMSCAEYHEAKGLYGNQKIPDPITLYNKMAALLTRAEKEQINKDYSYLSDLRGNGSNGSGGNAPSKDHARGGKNKLRATDKDTLKSEKDAAREIADDVSNKQWSNSRRGGGYSDIEDINAFFQEYIYGKKDAEAEGINDFIARWETLKQLEGICHSIHKTFKAETVIEPYAGSLTRLGQELVCLGVSGPEVPLFFNDSQAGQGSKKKVCCYFDTSPSMNSFIPYMLHIADYIDECEEAEIGGGKYNGHYGFSEKVKGIPDDQWEEFKEGKIRGGFGTCFNAVAKHAIDRVENDDVDIILVFTDGYSGLDDETVERFNESGKKCYTIYFSHPNFGYGHDRRGYGGNIKGQDEVGMTSDLDRLDGESFTIWCTGEH